ncbi:MAG TPA: hypothetical protein VGL72_15610 [Bryobacteraceae bacterium]|jgi:hypothetical protein
MRLLDQVVDKEDVRHMSDAEMAERGITVVNREALTLQCLTCSHTWTPQLDSFGKLPFDYWLCPSNCNQ